MTPAIIPDYSIWDAFVMIITFLSPNIVAIVNQPKWNSLLKGSVYFIFNILIAFVFLGQSDKLDLSNLTGTSIQLFIYSVASYMGFWKPIADKIEVLTSKPEVEEEVVSEATLSSFKHNAAKGGFTISAAKTTPFIKKTTPRSPLDNMYVEK